MSEHEEPKAVLEKLLQLMGLEGTVQSSPETHGEVLLHIESAEAGRLIGRGAQVLEALQMVLNRMVGRRDMEHPIHYIVDVERYRERQKDRLIGMAKEAAEQVAGTGEPVKLAPMNAAERRIVHQTLKDDVRVQTQSEETGEHDQKRVVVAPRSAEPAGGSP